MSKIKVKLECIRAVINLPEDFVIEESSVNDFTKSLKDTVKANMKLQLGADCEVIVVTEKKARAEILYSKGKYRIIKTRHCKAKVQYNKGKAGEVQWVDKAFFGTGNDEECYNEAIEEINKISGRGKSRRTRKKKKKKDLRKSMSKDEMDALIASIK